MELLVFLIPFVLLGAAVLFIAFSGGPGKAREAYLTRGGAAFKVFVTVAFVVLGVAVPALVLANRDEASGGTGALRSEHLTEKESNGKSLFRQRCASCHTLGAVNARGVTGPNLDRIGKVTPRPDQDGHPRGRHGPGPDAGRAAQRTGRRRRGRVPHGRRRPQLAPGPRTPRTLQQMARVRVFSPTGAPATVPAVDAKAPSGAWGNQRPRGQGRTAGNGPGQLFLPEPDS